MPGVGKTTYAKELEKDLGAKHFSLDEMVYKEYGNKYEDGLDIREYAVKYSALKEITERLRNKQVTLLDYGFFKKAERDWYRQLASDHDVESEVHFVTADYDTQLERVLKRNQTVGNIHYIDKEILDFLITLFEKPTDEDVVIVQT